MIASRWTAGPVPVAPAPVAPIPVAPSPVAPVRSRPWKKLDTGTLLLINNQAEPVGTRIFGPVPRELRAKNHMKIVSLAPEVL